MSHCVCMNGGSINQNCWLLFCPALCIIVTPSREQAKVSLLSAAQGDLDFSQLRSQSNDDTDELSEQESSSLHCSRPRGGQPWRFPTKFIRSDTGLFQFLCSADFLERQKDNLQTQAISFFFFLKKEIHCSFTLNISDRSTPWLLLHNYLCVAPGVSGVIPGFSEFPLWNYSPSAKNPFLHAQQHPETCTSQALLSCCLIPSLY